MTTKIGYIIPEFPGQTHVWMWREITHLRQWGVLLTLFSTRRPSAETRARHAFADAAEAQTVYLWPTTAATMLGSIIWAMARHPIGFLRAAWLGITLPVDRRPAVKTVLPLLIPACVMARRCRRLGIQRLHSHSASNSALICMMVKRIGQIPFSITINADIEWWGGAMAEKFADADFTVAITQRLLDQMRRDYPRLSPAQTLLGRIGVDTTKWVPAPPVPRTDGQVRLMTVGRLHQAKGHDVLLRADKILADQGRDVTLRLAGAGPERDNLGRLAAELGLDRRVAFMGSLSEDRIIEELQAADVFVLASRAEPLGVVYMEAMALELPTIGTAAGGVGEIIRDGQDGVLVPPNDPVALAAAVVRLMDDDSARRRLGQAGRRRIVEAFDSRLGAETLYRRMFGGPPPGLSPD